MNVNRAACVPAGIDCRELDLAVFVRDLITAQKFLSGCGDVARAAPGIVGGFVGIDSFRIAVPDIDISTRERRTDGAAQVLNRYRETEGDAFPGHARCRIRSDVRAKELLIYPVWPFRYCRCRLHTDDLVRSFYAFVPRGNKECRCSGTRQPRQSASPVHQLRFMNHAYLPPVSMWFRCLKLFPLVPVQYGAESQKHPPVGFFQFSPGLGDAVDLSQNFGFLQTIGA